MSERKSEDPFVKSVRETMERYGKMEKTVNEILEEYGPSWAQRHDETIVAVFFLMTGATFVICAVAVYVMAITGTWPCHNCGC